jgi:hypothetical protein
MWSDVHGQWSMSSTRACFKAFSMMYRNAAERCSRSRMRSSWKPFCQPVNCGSFAGVAEPQLREGGKWAGGCTRTGWDNVTCGVFMDEIIPLFTNASLFPAARVRQPARPRRNPISRELLCLNECINELIPLRPGFTMRCRWSGNIQNAYTFAPCTFRVIIKLSTIISGTSGHVHHATSLASDVARHPTFGIGRDMKQSLLDEMTLGHGFTLCLIIPSGFLLRTCQMVDPMVSPFPSPKIRSTEAWNAVQPHCPNAARPPSARALASAWRASAEAVRVGSVPFASAARFHAAPA